MKKILLMFLCVFSIFAEETLENNFGSLLRVGITRFQNSSIVVKNVGSFKVIADDKEFLVERDTTVKFSISNGRLYFEDNSYKSISLEKIDQNGLFALSKDGKNFGRFRGNFTLRVVNGKILPINNVFAEEYLYSVVPSEIGSSFPDEAIKAQAVAARSYLYFNLSGSGSGYMDMWDNINSQMYLGYDRENSKINDLVNQTFNEILTYNGKVIQALFHSTSGGKTASNEDVWPSGKPIPYLRAVDDSENGTISPRQNWVVEISKSEFSKLAGFYTDNINILETGQGRAKYLELSGQKTKKVTGEELRRIIGVTRLYSTLFTVENKDKSFVFTGSGFGHGLGMPQYSAYTMAQNGKTYIDILTYYYTGVQLTKVKE